MATSTRSNGSVMAASMKTAYSEIISGSSRKEINESGGSSSN